MLLTTPPQTNPFATPGKGWFIGGLGLSYAYAQGGAADWNFAVNKVAIVEFTLVAPVTISKVITQVNANIAASHFGVGIYDANGNLLADSGALTAASGAGTPVSTALRQGTVTLPAGVYYFAWTSDTASLNMIFWGASIAPAPTIPNKNNVRYGTAANASTAGQLPATLGALTAVNVNSSQPFLAIFES